MFANREKEIIVNKPIRASGIRPVKKTVGVSLNFIVSPKKQRGDNDFDRISAPVVKKIKLRIGHYL